MLLVIVYATFGHSRPSGHLVCRDVAYKDRTRHRFFSGNSMRGGSKCMFQELIWTRRRVLIAYCLRRGVCSDSKCNTSCLLRNVMLHLVRMANMYIVTFMLGRAAVVQEGNIRKTMAARGLVNGRDPRSGRDLVFRCYPLTFLTTPQKKQKLTLVRL